MFCTNLMIKKTQISRESGDATVRLIMGQGKAPIQITSDGSNTLQYLVYAY